MIFKRWLQAAIFLLLVTFSYRASFLLYHQEILAGYSWWQDLYALFWGMRFDIAVVMPMALLSLILYGIAHKFVHISWRIFVLPWVAVMLFIHTGDTLYFQDSGRHIGLEILASTGDIFGLVQHALHTGLSLVITNLLIGLVLMFLGWKWLNIKVQHTQSMVKTVLFSVVIVLVTAIGVRGGVTGIPQAPIHVYQIGDAKLANVAANPVYITMAIYGSKHKDLKPLMLPQPKQSQQDTLAALYPEEKQAEATAPKAYNIIFILLESWNAAFMQSYNANEPHNVTPNFDAFRAQAISSDLTLAGGHRTVEGAFASMCSWQNPLGTSLVKTQLVDLPYLCLPEILNQQGYATSFIQGSYRDTGSVGSFAQKLGFEVSLGKVELPEGKLEHNSWGLHDDDLYDIIFEKALVQQAPFFFAVNTTSTHDTTLLEGVEPLLDAKDHADEHKNVMHYADAALGRFLAKFQQSPLAKHTILVVVADHTAQVHDSDLYEYMIPMAILAPETTAKLVPFATSQRDIAPTLLELLGLPASPSFSGKSLLSSEVFFADYFHQQHLGWIEGDKLVRINIDHAGKDCFHWRDDLLLEKPFTCEQDSALAEHALNFTRLQQGLLFTGQTRNYLDHIHQ